MATQPFSEVGVEGCCCRHRPWKRPCGRAPVCALQVCILGLGWHQELGT